MRRGRRPRPPAVRIPVKKGCRTGKVGYRNGTDALIALNRLHHQEKDGHHEWRVYECPFCKQWHGTSQTERQRP